MTSPKRAQNVCQACLSRKKACDKTLPACGYCVGRGVSCSYDTPTARAKGRRAYNPGRFFVALPSPPAPDQFPEIGVKDALPGLYTIARPLDESVDRLAQEFCQRASLTYDDLTNHYFQTFHTWFHIVSPESFRLAASQHGQRNGAPPADLTLLRLAMLLIALPCLDPSKRPSLELQESLYIAVKSTFSQVQASICASLRLCQAALLIALREYTSVRPQNAYVSLMTCAGMARVLGIGESSMRTGMDTQETADPRADIMEREHLAWAIVMTERLILCEMDQPYLTPQTGFPQPGFRLPSDFATTKHAGVSLTLNQNPLNQVTLGDLNAKDAGHFGRVAQAAYLLDQMLSILRRTAFDKRARFLELRNLEETSRNFLSTVMGDLEWRKALICVPVSLCVRLFFILHYWIHDSLKYPVNEREYWQRGKSCMGLDMACRMMLQAAHWHEQGGGCNPAMPICCFYNLRAAKACLINRNRIVEGAIPSEDIDSISLAAENYRAIWCLSDAQGRDE